jgi:hypothetical protein
VKVDFLWDNLPTSNINIERSKRQKWNNDVATHLTYVNKFLQVLKKRRFNFEFKL